MKFNTFSRAIGIESSKRTNALKILFIADAWYKKIGNIPNWMRISVKVKIEHHARLLLFRPSVLLSRFHVTCKFLCTKKTRLDSVYIHKCIGEWYICVRGSRSSAAENTIHMKYRTRKQSIYAHKNIVLKYLSNLTIIFTDEWHGVCGESSHIFLD